MMDGQMQPGIPGHLQQMGQGQILPNQKLQDQAVSLPLTQAPPPTPRQMPPMQMKSHAGATYGHQENLTYCALPVEYVQRIHPNQPCHPMGPAYYGQSSYHSSQQVVLNQPVPHGSPHSGQHQVMYFRPSHGVNMVYPRMQGSSHGWGEYRMRMEQMPMYGHVQHGNNPSLYINPVAGDQFGSSTGASPLEGRRFSNPNHGYGPGHCYRIPHVQQFQPYMVTTKSSNVGWIPVDHSVQRSIDQPHKQPGALPVNPAGEATFPRQPSTMHMSNPAGQAVAQNYIPGKRLEHFSPGMPSCGGSVVISPVSRPNAECMDEFSGLKVQPMGHGATEFASHHYPMYGPMLSPGGQFRQGTPLRGAVAMSDMHQGPCTPRSYGGQTFGDAFHPRCQYPNMPRLQSPNFYPYVSTKCEPDIARQCYEEEPSVGTDPATALSGAAQGRGCGGEILEQVLEDLSETDNHLVSRPLIASFCSAPSLVTQSFVGIANSVLTSSSLERTSCTMSSQLSSVIKSGSTDELNRQNVFDKALPSVCSMSSIGSISNSSSTAVTGTVAEQLKESASCRDGASSEAQRNALADLYGSSSTLSSHSIVSVAVVSVACSSVVVTQMASTSTTYAMTTSTAASVSKQCALTTGAVKLSVPPLTTKDMTAVSFPLERLQSNFLTYVGREQNLGTASVKLSNSPAADQPSSLTSLQMMTRPLAEAETESTCKTELAMCQPHRKPVRAKRKKGHLKNVQHDPSVTFVLEIPKTEANLTSIKLEETNDTISNRPGSFSFPSSKAVKQMLNPLLKESCLDASVAKDSDTPAFKTSSIGTPALCLQKMDLADIKGSPGKRPVTVPFGWKRKLKEGRVVYLSPTAVELDSLDQIRHYLLSEGTCKCGLQCPLIVDDVFVFDPDVESRHLCANDVRCDVDMTNLCNHKRKIVAMAAFQHSTGLQINTMDRMQFRSSSNAVVPSVDFETKSECDSVDLFPGKLSSDGLFVASSQKPQQGSGNDGAYERASLERCEDLGNVDAGIYVPDGGGKWPSMMNSSGLVRGTKCGSMMEGMISNSIPMGNYGRPSAIGGQELDQSLNLPVSSPNAVNQLPGSFATDASGYFMAMHHSGSVVGGLHPHVGLQRGPPIYSPRRSLWPPFEENRFTSPYCSRPGQLGMQFQSKLCTGDSMWPYRQSTAPTRFGINMIHSYGNCGTVLDEQKDMLSARAYDNESHCAVGCVEPWSITKYTPGGSKSVRKGRKKVVKKEKPYSSILEKSRPCPNIDVRQIIQEQQERIQCETPGNGGSQLYATNSADNLATFLAQQTVLVNQTLPIGLGCTSPAEDSDITQSASTVCSNTDEIASCIALSRSSPVIEKAITSLPFSKCLDDKKNCDDTLKRTDSTSETNVDSVCHVTSSTVSQMVAPHLHQMDANPLSAASSEAGLNEKSATDTGFNFTAQNMHMPVTNVCMVSNVDHGSVCFNSSVEANEVGAFVGQLGPKISRDQLPAKVLPAPFFESISQNNRFISPAGMMMPHQLPQNPSHSNHLYRSIPPTWLYSNPMHSKSQLYIPSGGKRPTAASFISSSGDCSKHFLNQQKVSSYGRSEHVSTVPSSSAAADEVVPDNCASFRPVFVTCPLGANQTSEAFADFPEGVSTTSGAVSHQCAAETRESYLYSQPTSGCTSTVDSPIALVQNMVSGLVTTQNSLAMVTAMIANQSESSRRRKYSSCNDPSRAVLSQGIPLAAAAAAATVMQPRTSDEVEVSTSTSSGCLEVLPSTSTECPALVGSVCSPANAGIQVDMSAAETGSSENLTVAMQPMAAITAVTNVTQVVPMAGLQPSFSHSLHVPPIVQVLNPLNIALPGTPILLNDQVLAFGGQDSTILQQGLAVPGVGQLHITPHLPQSQMVVFPTGQGATMLALQPSQSALVPEFPAEDSSHAENNDQVEKEVGEEEEEEEMEQMGADDMMRTTGTQTSTPASSFSNCNSLDSGENELDNSEVLCPDQSVSSSTREDGISVKDCCKRATKRTAQPTMAGILQQGQMSTAQVVVMPSVPQQPFVLPQGVAFAGALGSQGYLQLQQPVDFGFNANQVGLIHFGQITAAGGLIPAQALVGAMSVAGGGVVSSLAPEHCSAAQNVSSKPDPSSQPAFGTAEILHLMSPNVPQGHILVQNMPAFAPFAGAILPVVPQSALGTAICNFGGTQTIFAMSQGSLGIVTSVGAATAQQMPSSNQLFSDVAPEAPDSTVDSEDAISSNVLESESVVTSTDSPQTTITHAKLYSHREQVVASASGQVRPIIDLDSSTINESYEKGMKTPESSKDSPEFTDGKSTSKTAQLEVPDDGICSEDTLPSNQERNSHVHPGPSYGLSTDQPSDSSPVKLVRCRKKKKFKLHNRRRHMRTFVGPSSTYVTPTTELAPKDDVIKAGQEMEKSNLNARLKCSSPPAEGAASDRTVDGSADFLADVSKSLESSAEASSASTSMECHVTTSVSCNYGGSSMCRMQRPRASRLRMKIERTTMDQLNFSKRPSTKRSLEEEVNKDDRTQDADDADSTTSLPGINYPRSFNMGDLVWGPARGFPSWPGKLVPESEVRGNPKTEDGKIWVKWFGDHTFTQAEPDQLKTLSEGLETHHNARKKHRKGRRMNAKLEAAIQEAMMELDRQMMVEQSKQSLSTASLSDKATPVRRHWGTRRTKK